LIGLARAGQFPSDVLLSRSRYLAPATHSLRFYREYFRPDREISIEKDRLRWRVLFHGTEFYINLDRVDHPALGYFLEIKSRTWSRRDAQYKAQVITELIHSLGSSVEKGIDQDYLEMILSPTD
jgi:5-methylthioadenosine/S-adenosylhomocysteine deaminase